MPSLSFQCLFVCHINVLCCFILYVEVIWDVMFYGLHSFMKVDAVVKSSF